MGKTYPAVLNPRPIMLIGECFDLRYRKAFRDFTRTQLHLKPGEFISIQRAGGMAALAHPFIQRGAHADTMNQVDFATRNFVTIAKVVVFGHQDCGFYTRIPTHRDKPDKEKNDLPGIVDALHQKFPKLEVDQHFAYFTDGSRAKISFDLSGTTYEAIQNPKPEIIIIEDFDPRFRKALRSFTKEELGVRSDQFINIQRAGGPAVLAHPAQQHGACTDVLNQIGFAIGHFPTIKRVVAIGNSHCGFYNDIVDHPETEEKEKKDLPKVAKTIREMFTTLEVECHYARFLDEKTMSRISFEKIV